MGYLSKPSTHSWFSWTQEKTYDFRYKGGARSEPNSPSLPLKMTASPNIKQYSSSSGQRGSIPQHTQPKATQTPFSISKTKSKKTFAHLNNKTKSTESKPSSPTSSTSAEILRQSELHYFPTPVTHPQPVAALTTQSHPMSAPPSLAAGALLPLTNKEALNAPTTANSKKTEPTSAEKIIEHLLHSPHPNWAKQALEAVYSGELSEIQYFSITKELATRSDPLSEQTAIYLLSQWPGKSSFITFIEIIQTKPEWAKKQNLWQSYQNVSTVHSLLPLLTQTENPQILHWGLKLVAQFITQIPSSTPSSLTSLGPSRRQGWSRYSIRTSEENSLNPSQQVQWMNWLRAISLRPLQDQWRHWVQNSLQHLQSRHHLIAETSQD